MTDQEQKDVRAYCASLLHQYGIQFSPTDPVIPALFVIHKEMQLNKKGNEQLAEMVKEVSAKIKPQEFHFNREGEAWGFQMGAAFKWILMGLLIVILFLIGSWYWNLSVDIRNADQTIKSSEEIRSLINRVQNDKGHYFIDFSSTEFKRLNSKNVRLILHKKSNQ
jgi:hypothetical protein